MGVRLFLASLLLILSAGLLFSLNIGTDAPVLDGGILDCREWDFTEKGMIRLKGEAEFHWMRLLEPEEVSSTGPGTLVRVPSAWNNLRNAEYPPKGYGTYRMTLLLPEGLSVLGIYLSNQDSSSRLYADGKLLSESGTPGTSRDSTIPARIPRTLYPAVQDGRLELIVQVANFEHHLGGLNNKIILGTPDQISELNRLYLSFFLLLLGGFMLLFLYHGTAFAFRPSDRTHLYIALFTLVLSLRVLFTGEYIGYQWFPWVPWAVGLKYEYLSMPLFVFFFTLFLSEMLPGRVPGPFLKILGFFTLLPGVIILFLPARITAGHLTLPVQLITLFSGLGVFVLLLKTVIEKESGSALLIIGLGGLLLTAVWDVLVWNKVLPGRLVGPMMYPGFLFFILVNSLALSRRMASDYRRLDYLNTSLEEEVARRTEELKEANGKIKESAEAQMNFMIHLAHEIKTPLTLIINHLNAFCARTGQSRELDIIRHNLDRLLRDIVDFFDIYKVARGQNLYPDRQRTDFTALLDDALVLMESSFRKKNLILETSITGSLFVRADPRSLERVIFNLLENAVKYNREGGTIRVTASGADSFLFFTVEDTGVGIPEENLSDIFLPYYRIARKDKRIDGMGIGLAVVRQIVESLSGSVSCSSPAEEGCLFTVRLPLESMDALPEKKTALSFPEKENQEEEGSPARVYGRGVLIVEDDPDIRDLLREGLRDEYRLHLAGDGRAALELLKNIPRPSLILSDVMMNEMNGDELLRHLKADPAFRDIPFLLCTARSYDEDALSAYEAGALDFICKPFLLPELRAKIRSLLAFTEMKEELARNERLASYGTVLSGLAHEIRNPLSGITGPLGVIKKYFDDGPGVPPSLRKHFEHIRENLGRINSLMVQMKDLYGEEKPERTELFSAALVRDVLAAVTVPGGIRIQADIPDTCRVAGHPAILKLSLIQVVKNAVEALGERGTIGIKTNPPDGPGGFIVTDDGPGIPADILSSIFEPFRTTRQAPGRGLGLTIARSLLARIDWRIYCLPGKSTGMIFVLEEKNDE